MMDAVAIPQGDIPTSALGLASLEQSHRRKAVHMVFGVTSSPRDSQEVIPDLQRP